MSPLPALDPVFNPNTGVMTTAVPAGMVQGLPKPAPKQVAQPQQIEPDVQAILDETDRLMQPSAPAPTGAQPQLEPEIQSILDEADKLMGVTPPVAPIAAAPTPKLAEPSFLQKSTEAWKVGWAQYAANKLRGISVLPGVRDELLMQKADQINALVTPEAVQRVSELTGGQLKMDDFWGIVKQLPTIGWYGMIQNAPQMFDAMIAFQVGGKLGGAIGGVGGPKGMVIGRLLGGHAAGVASAGLTESGAFKQEQVQSLRAAGIDEATIKILSNTVVDKYARMYGPAAGVVEYASNIFQLGKASRGLRKTAIQALRKTPIWKLMLDPLTGGLSEGGEELSQGWLSRQASNLMWDEIEKTTGKKFQRPEPTDLRPGGISGLAIGTMMGAMGLPVSISSKRSQGRQASEEKAKSIVQYKEDLRANFINTIGIPADVVDKSGVIDKMVAAEGDVARTKVLDDFAEQNLAGEVAPAPEAPAAPLAEPPLVAPPPPVGGVIAPLAGQPAAKPAEPTGLPPITEVKPTKPPTITPAVAGEAIPAPAIPAAGKPAVEAPVAKAMPELPTIESLSHGSIIESRSGQRFFIDKSNPEEEKLVELKLNGTPTGSAWSMDAGLRNVIRDSKVIFTPEVAIKKPAIEAPVVAKPTVEPTAEGKVPELMTPVDPETLVFREEEQHRIAEMRDIPTAELSPIVTIIEEDGTRTILDGHNRAALAKERGDKINTVDLTQDEYNKLSEAGYDDMEISYAVLARMEDASEGDISGYASELNAQFAGAGVSKYGDEAKRLLTEPPSPPPAPTQPKPGVKPETIPTEATAGALTPAQRRGMETRLKNEARRGTQVDVFELFGKKGIRGFASGELKEEWKDAMKILKSRGVKSREDDMGAMTPDEAVGLAYEAGIITEETQDALIEHIKNTKTTAELRAEEKQRGEYEDYQAAEAERKATAEETFNKKQVEMDLSGKGERITVPIQEGDTFTVMGEKYRAGEKTKVNGEPGVMIKDGHEFFLPFDVTKHMEGIFVDKGSLKRAKPTKAVPQDLIAAADMPFNLKGAEVRVAAAKPPIAKPETIQTELFKIQKIAKEVDPKKSADAAEQLYGGAEGALKMLKRQVAVIDSDPTQKKLYSKEARGRLGEVFNLLEQRVRDKKRASMAVPGQVLKEVKATSAQSVVDQFTKKWRNKPKGGILVVQSESDADTLNLSDESMRAMVESRAEGFYHIPTDTVVIIADNLERTSDVIRVAIHESVVHSGLRKMLGTEFAAELGRIGKSVPENELTDIALLYEFDLSKAEGRLDAIEEYLGQYAPTRNPTLYQRFLSAVRRALRAMGINEHLVDAFDRRGEIERLVDAGREFVEKGGRVEPLPQREGVRLALTPRVPEGTAKKDIDESRFLKRAALSQDFTPEAREALKQYAPYKIQHNPETKAEIDRVLTENGPNESEQMFFREDKTIIPAARIPLGAALSHMHIEIADKATDPALKKGHMEAAIDIMKKMADMGKESGQVSQSFTMYYSGEMLETPGGAELMLNRIIDETVQKTIGQLPVTIPEVTQAMERARTEDASEALVAKRVQEGIAKILHRIALTARNGLTARLRNADNRLKGNAFFASAEAKAQATEDFKFAATKLTLEEKIERAVKFGSQLIFNSKVLDLSDWSAKMKARYGEGISPYLLRVWDESAVMLDNVFRGKAQPLAVAGAKVEPEAKKPPRRTVTMTTEMNRLVQEWLAAPVTPATIAEPTERKFEDITQPTLPDQKTIIASLADLGMTEREGFKFITDVQREAAKRAQAKKEKRLKQLLKGEPISPGSQSAIDRIMEISSIRRLDDAEIMDIFAEKMGLPKITPELAGKLEALAEKIRKAPIGYPKIQSGREMMAFMKKQMPLNKMEVGWSMWYANILSGYQTQERNIISTFNNVMANLATSIAVDPKNAPFAIAGMVSGIKRGWREAKFTIATGETPVHITPEYKLEVPNTLELSPFTGWAKVFNNWKYVMRVMIAEDMTMFKPSQESRAMMIAADLAREEGLSGTLLWGRVAEIMGTTQEAAFEQQAMTEGFTGLRLRHRIDELMEQARPAEVQEPAVEYAKRATFNYQPEGMAGYLGELVRGVQARAPSPAARVLARFIVPFTRIVANVTNTSIDYSPWGFVRVMRGIRQEGGEQRQIVGHERAQRKAKAFLGTAAMIAAYALDVLNDDDDEEKKKFAIYGSGTGSSAKNNQLRELGWKPWSVKVGKYYFDYRLTPLAIPFGIIGSIRDALRWRKLDEKSISARMAFGILRSLSVIQDMSFLSGMNQFMNLINVDSPEKAERNARTFITRSTVGVVVPNIFKQLDRTFDPVLRDNSTFIEAIMREIPVASRGVDPRLNVLGETIPQQTGPVSLVFSPAREDPLWRLIAKNEAWISVPEKTQHLGKRIMTEDEFYRFIKYRGERLRARIERRMTYLEGLSKEKFNDRIDDYTRDATKQAKNRIRRENRD